MELVKINLTQEKVAKMMDRAEATDVYVRPFAGHFTDNDKKVMEVVDAFREKVNFEKVIVANKRLIAGNQGGNKMISSFFIDKGIKTSFAIKLEGAHVELIYNTTHNAIELWWLEVDNQSKGLGTKLMNDLLDVVEELGYKLYLTPVPFKNKKVYTNKQMHNAFVRLRNWYESFGFETITNEPSLIF